MDDEEKLVCRNTVLRKKFFHTISEKMIYGWSESNIKWFFSILFDMLDVQKTRDAWLRNIVLPACVCECVCVFSSFRLPWSMVLVVPLINQFSQNCCSVSVSVSCVCYLKYRSIYKWFCYSVKVIRFSECVLNVLLLFGCCYVSLLPTFTSVI